MLYAVKKDTFTVRSDIHCKTNLDLATAWNMGFHFCLSGHKYYQCTDPQMARFSILRQEHVIQVSEIKFTKYLHI